MKNTCCVPFCESKRSSVKLHRFPSSEIGLKWVENINCARLKELSLEELHKLFLCHKHFEKRFVTSSLRLHRSAYPTLFTYKEMNTGIPSRPHQDSENQNVLRDHDYLRKRKHEDHSYYKHQPLKELQQSHDYSVPSTSKEITFSKPIENTRLQDHTDYIPSATIEKTAGDNVKQQQFIPDEVPSTDIILEEIVRDKAAQQPLIPDLAGCSYVATPKKAIVRKFCIRRKNLTPRCQRMLKEYSKAKRQLNYHLRAKRAMKFSKQENFDKMTKSLNPLAKKLLWMQITQCTKKTKGWRFTDEEKTIALAIMKQSPRSYKFLRKIFILPSTRTLNKMVNKLKVESGINPHLFKTMKAEIENWQESKKYCSLIFDEVALEPGLSYDKNKDNICGLVELQTKTKDYADHALVFMVRGALHKWQQPIAYYFCEGATSAHILKNIIKEVLTEIIKTGLIPVALVSDQGTAFQSAINKLKEDTRKKQILEEESIDETIMIGEHNISVIFDPPHLIKGLRNNFLNKDIKWDGKISKWSDIVDVYLTDCKHAQARFLHKLNDEHVIPQKIKKMKVKNCTRVLSQTVASALAYTAEFSHYTDGREVSSTLRNTSETVSFLDNLFDSCNGAALSIQNKGKPLRQPVTLSSKHETFWNNAIKKLEQMRFVNKEGKECTVPSQKNFITTLKSLIRLWHFFKEKGFKIMRPRYLNSDPIENFFGQMRAYSFRNNDPNCQTFKNMFRSLLITRFINFHSESYNCEESSGEQIIKLKKLFESNQEQKVQMPSSSCTRIVSPEETENIQVEARRERLNVHSSAYTAGWVVRKCLKKFNCRECKSSLTQVDETSVHKWISHREYKDFKNKHKLTYPSEYAVRYFSIILKETNEYLDSKPNSNEIVKEILKQIKSKYKFEFLSCQCHKEALLDYFVSITIILTVINWCNIINKIIKGVDILRLCKHLPYMQNKALIKYKKKIKNKRLNK